QGTEAGGNSGREAAGASDRRPRQYVFQNPRRSDARAGEIGRSHRAGAPERSRGQADVGKETKAGKLARKVLVVPASANVAGSAGGGNGRYRRVARVACAAGRRDAGCAFDQRGAS